MRPCLFLMCLMLAALLCACSTKWENPGAGDKAQTKALLQKDSDECNLKAGEEYPLDKRRQARSTTSAWRTRGGPSATGRSVSAGDDFRTGVSVHG